MPANEALGSSLPDESGRIKLGPGCLPRDPAASGAPPAGGTPHGVQHQESKPTRWGDSAAEQELRWAERLPEKDATVESPPPPPAAAAV